MVEFVESFEQLALFAWFEITRVAQGMINAADVQLFKRVGELEAMMKIIFSFYERRGLSPLAEEQEILLHL